jgi:hypothetical protein
MKRNFVQCVILALFCSTAFAGSSWMVGASVQPLVIIGEGWTQQFTIINVDYYQGGSATTGTVSFYTRDGQRWKIPLKNVGTVDHVNVRLSSGHMTSFETEVLQGPQELGWAYFDLDQPLTNQGIYHAYTVFRKQESGRPDLMTSVAFVDGFEDEWIIPFDNLGAKYAGVGLVNTSADETITLTLQVFNDIGGHVKTIKKDIEPLHLEWFSLTGENPELAEKRGQIKATGGIGQSAVFTLQFAPHGAFTGLPVVHTFGMR